MSKVIRLNEQITAPELRVIDDAEGNLGVLAREEALARAADKDLDLIEISPTANPPVVKIMDFGKYQYQLKRQARAARAKTHQTETKSLQIKIGTGEHDLKLKADKIAKFLSAGHRVKIELFLPGRAKYLGQDFLKERVDRFLNIIPAEFKVAEAMKKSPKGLAVIIERVSEAKKS